MALLSCFSPDSGAFPHQALRPCHVAFWLSPLGFVLWNVHFHYRPYPVIFPMVKNAFRNNELNYRSALRVKPVRPWLPSVVNTKNKNKKNNKKNNLTRQKQKLSNVQTRGKIYLFFFCRCQSCFANRLFWMQSACFLMKGCENVKETLSRLFVTARAEGNTDAEEKGINEWMLGEIKSTFVPTLSSYEQR